MTTEEIPQVVEFVRQRIKDHHIDLKLEEREYRVEDEWLYLVVTPARPGIRASDYAKEMSDIEKELHERNIYNVILVPTIEE